MINVPVQLNKRNA